MRDLKNVINFDSDFLDKEIKKIELHFKHAGVKKGDTVRLIDKESGINAEYEVTKIKYIDDISGIANLKFKRKWRNK